MATIFCIHTEAVGPLIIDKSSYVSIHEADDQGRLLTRREVELFHGSLVLRLAETVRRESDREWSEGSAEQQRSRYAPFASMLLGV